MELLIIAFVIGFVVTLCNLPQWYQAGKCPICKGPIPDKAATKCMHCGTPIYMDE